MSESQALGSGWRKICGVMLPRMEWGGQSGGSGFESHDTADWLGEIPDRSTLQTLSKMDKTVNKTEQKIKSAIIYLLCLIFITLSIDHYISMHELSHSLVCEYFGGNASIHYGMNLNNQRLTFVHTSCDTNLSESEAPYYTTLQSLIEILHSAIFPVYLTLVILTALIFRVSAKYLFGV